MSAPDSADPRTAELAANLAAVRQRIAAAASAAGRDPAEVTLVAVTKTWPAYDVRRLASLGVTDVAENRDQEGAPKHRACDDLPLRWHFVGQLQRNKARSVASYADVVESVDRLPLVTALSRAAVELGRALDALVQVNLDPAAPAGSGRGGALPADVTGLAAAVAAAPGLRLAGLMAVAPLGEDPAAAFARLAALAADLRRDHPAAAVLSAGMSGDLEQAVAAGATHVRVGSALLGHRPPLR